MKLADLRKKLRHSESRALGQKPLKGSREHRLLVDLEKLELVILSANGYYMIRDKGRAALEDRARHARSVEQNIAPIFKGER